MSAPPPTSTLAPIDREVWCEERGLVLQWYRLRRGGAWLTWTETGELVQATPVDVESAVVLPTAPDEPVLLVSSDGERRRAAIDALTGEVVWARSDARLPTDGSAEWVSGTVGGARAVALRHRSKVGWMLAAATGEPISGELIASPSPRSSPCAFRAIAPPPQRVPWIVNLRPGRNPFVRSDEPPTALEVEIRRWLADGAPASSAPRSTLSAPIARQLTRLSAAERGAAQPLTDLETKTIRDALGEVDEDVLALYRARSPLLMGAWGLAPDRLSALHRELPTYMKRLPALRALGRRGDAEIVALTEPWNGPRVVLVDGNDCAGPMALATWLSERVLELGRASAHD